MGNTAHGEKELEMKQIRVIKTQRDYDDAVARLSDLMDEEVKAGSNKEGELELLALVIESYERAKIDPVFPDPIEAIFFRMDQMGLNKKDLIPYFGSLPKVSEVLARKRPLSLSMIRKIHKGLGIPAEILLGGTDAEDIDLTEEPQYDGSKFPWAEMLSRGYFPGFTGSVRVAKENWEELLRGFMKDVLSAPRTPALLRARLHQSGARVMDDYALLAWQIAVLKKARQQKHTLKTPYKRGSVTAEWLRDLAKLSRFEHGPRLAIEYLADIGIILVIEEHFKKTYLDGAAMLDDGTPVVALTLRHDRIDNFWFALLHELVHVQKHLNPDHLFIADNLDDKTRSSKEEDEADAGAQEALIPAAEWAAANVSSNPTAANAVDLADKLRIHPTIVAGRVRHETENWRLLKGMAGEVRHLFADQLGCVAQAA